MDEPPRRSRRPFQLVGEIIGELNKVAWPSREDALRLSLMVVSVAVTVGVILATLDFGFNMAAEAFLF
jgi:preprotein translocase SecE subunit